MQERILWNRTDSTRPVPEGGGDPDPIISTADLTIRMPHGVNNFLTCHAPVEGQFGRPIHHGSARPVASGREFPPSMASALTRLARPLLRWPLDPVLLDFGLQCLVSDLEQLGGLLLIAVDAC